MDKLKSLYHFLCYEKRFDATGEDSLVQKIISDDYVGEESLRSTYLLANLTGLKEKTARELLMHVLKNEENFGKSWLLHAVCNYCCNYLHNNKTLSDTIDLVENFQKSKQQKKTLLWYIHTYHEPTS